MLCVTILRVAHTIAGGGAQMGTGGLSPPRPPHFKSLTTDLSIVVPD